MSITKRVIGAAGLVSLLSATSPASATYRAAAEPTCTPENGNLPSCKPHPGWYCFHQGMLEPLFNTCDPNDTGC